MPVFREKETVIKLAKEANTAIREKISTVPHQYWDFFVQLEHSTRIIAEPRGLRGRYSARAQELVQKNQRNFGSKLTKEHARKLRRLVKTAPKYGNVAFKCINDYDKCRLQRGPRATICALAFILCIMKNGGGLLKAAAKVASIAGGSG